MFWKKNNQGGTQQVEMGKSKLIAGEILTKVVKGKVLENAS